MGGVVSNVVGGVGDAVGGVLDSDLGKAALIGGTLYATGGLSGLGLGGAEAAGLTGVDAAMTDLAASTPAFGSAAAPSLFSGAVNWAKANPLSAAGLGLTAASALGGGLGNKPTSSTTTTAIDPDMKAAYLRNLQEARTTAANLGPRQFAEFPQYNLGMVEQYMNPYQEEVVNNAMKDIERQRQIQTANEGAQAVSSRAFGGSRQAVQRALVDEAALRQGANIGAQLRQQGFTQAQNLALQQEQLRQAYEQQKLDAARNLGLERLNVSQGALSLQPANLGSTQTSPIYRNQTASALGGALSGGMLGRMVGGTANPEYAGYGALAGGLLGFM
jgi:hypothetical protein